MIIIDVSIKKVISISDIYANILLLHILLWHFKNIKTLLIIFMNSGDSSK